MVDFTWKGAKPPDQTPRQGDYFGDAAREMEEAVKAAAAGRQEVKANVHARLVRKGEPQAGQEQEAAPEATQETTPNTPQKQTGLLNIALAGLMQGIAQAALGTPEPDGTPDQPQPQPQASMPAYNPVQAEKTAPPQGMNADVLAQAREAGTGARAQVQQTDQSASPDAAKASRQNAGHEQAKREASNQQQR